MTADTIFRLYSMSKPITSVAAMMLVEDGKLPLDDPVSKYIPAFADAKVGVEKASEPTASGDARAGGCNRPITIEDLLRHTSGITYGFYGENLVRKLYAEADLFNGDLTNAEFAERIAHLPLAEQPGTLWDYGHSTDVLGRVIEVVSGQSLFQFEKERLLDPLGMTETAFYVADADKRPRIAEPMPDDRADQSRAPDPRSAPAAQGRIRRRRDGRNDRRLRALCADAAERRRLDGRRYLKPETVALMTSDHIGPETGIARDYALFPGDDERLRPRLCRAHVACRRTRRGRSANTAGTASPARSSSSIPRTTCSWSSWCRRRRSAAGSNWR